jgi:hypothetical protein
MNVSKYDSGFEMSIENKSPLPGLEDQTPTCSCLRKQQAISFPERGSAKYQITPSPSKSKRRRRNFLYYLLVLAIHDNTLSAQPSLAS